MFLNKCSICSKKLTKEHGHKHICNEKLCQSYFEIMNNEDRKNHKVDEKAVLSYKVNNPKGEDNTTYCNCCGSELIERCSMYTIGTNKQKRTTIFTCSGEDCTLEYHVVDTLANKEKSKNPYDFRVIEVYKNNKKY